MLIRPRAIVGDHEPRCRWPAAGPSGPNDRGRLPAVHRVQQALTVVEAGLELSRDEPGYEEAATEDESTNARRAAAYLRTLPEAAFRAALRTVTIEGTKALPGVAT
jgi:hypothetical protein